MSYERENNAKACFDSVYTEPTPHAYVAEMAKNGYEIGEQAKPYCVAAAELLKASNGDAWPVQMLDVGCSYGIGSAFVKYGCSFDEMVAFFASRAPRDYRGACEAARIWLNVTPPVCDIRCVGLDSSEPAVRFAMEAGMLDGGIARDYEAGEAVPTEEERTWFRSCNLLISTGAIGYVTERTLGFVLQDLGSDHPGDLGPCAVVTILRMFDPEPIKAVFEDHGFLLETVPGARLPQRRFIDGDEREKVLAILHGRGVDTREWEDQGKHFADLFVAAQPEHLPQLLEPMEATRLACEDEPELAGYIRR